MNPNDRPWKWNAMYQEGVLDEIKTMHITEEHFGGRTYKATQEEDTQQHIDFWWENNNGKRYGFDVKGVKRNNRTDTKKDDSIQWVELTNVQGKRGWVYGDACYIVFLTNNSAIYIPRKKLASFIEISIEGKPTVYQNPKECYIPYQRYGRKDKIVKVPTEDLYPLAKHIIPLTTLN